MSEKDSIRKRIVILGAGAGLLLALACIWGIFVFYPRPLPPDRAKTVIERRTSPLPHREKLLDDAIRLHGEGLIDAAIRKLAPEALRIINSRDRKGAAYNTDLLFAFWCWKQLRNPEQVKEECRSVLEFDPDNLAAKVMLGRLLPPAYPELLRRTPAPDESAQLAAQFRELLQCGGLTPDQRSEFSYLLALADCGIWLARGKSSAPGGEGYTEREEALRLCRSFPSERRFAQLRHDILFQIWSDSWFFTPQQRIDGRTTGREKLQKELIHLSRKLR